MSIIVDSTSCKWITTSNGLWNRWRHWTILISIADMFFHSFWAIAIDNSRNIWLGTHGGLVKFYDYPPATDTIDSPDIPDNPGTGIFNNLENSFIIYPNPVVNNLVISCGEFANIGIYDMYGKLLLETAIIDISFLQSGTYFVKVFSHKGIVTKKIVKQ
jgi:hypothetical protein